MTTGSGYNQSGLAGEDRLAELEALRAAGLRRLAKQLAPLTDALIDQWAPLFAQARRDRDHWLGTQHRPRRHFDRRKGHP